MPRKPKTLGSTKDTRASAALRGYDAEWRKARKLFLVSNPLCVQCAAEGRVVPATVVDHITPHKGNNRLFWDEGNWQPLCATHHNRKTARHDR
jgi:5-methylcytosine-specific restriction protein A